MAPIDGKVVGLSKKKILLAILGGCVFVAIGIWLLSLDDAALPGRGVFNNPFLIRGVGVVSIVFFGAAALFGLPIPCSAQAPARHQGVVISAATRRLQRLVCLHHL